MTGIFLATSPAQARAVTLTDHGTGSCVSGISQYGAYPNLRISDDVTWNSATSLHIETSTAKGNVYDCGPAGRQVSGGNYSFSESWQATGSGLSSCTISTTQAGCSVSGKLAKSYYSKSGKNSGSASYSDGDWDVTASKSGSVESFSHSATYRLSLGDDDAEATTSNYSVR